MQRDLNQFTKEGRRFYTAKEIGEYLALKEDTIRHWVSRGQIPFLKLGKALRFDMMKIESWLKDKECAYVRREFS